jgi:hypothetical protein
MENVYHAEKLVVQHTMLLQEIRLIHEVCS